MGKPVCSLQKYNAGDRLTSKSFWFQAKTSKPAANAVSPLFTCAEIPERKILLQYKTG